MIDKNTITTEYFEWLVDCVCTESFKPNKGRYRKLFEHLHAMEFEYMEDIPMDENRMIDGIDCRWHFAYQTDRKHLFNEIERYLNGPCTVLEMMVALSEKAQNMIGDLERWSAAHWFWIMIDSLDLINMTNANYEPDWVDGCVEVFLDREYGWHGDGGLFIIKEPPTDMRFIEIWQQLNLYIRENV